MRSDETGPCSYTNGNSRARQHRRNYDAHRRSTEYNYNEQSLHSKQCNFPETFPLTHSIQFSLSNIKRIFHPQGVTFITFIAHMVPGVILVVIQTSLHFRYIFRDIHNLRLNESEELKNLRREISVWKRAAGSINSYSKDADVVKDTLLKKVRVLRRRLKKMETAGTVSTDDYNHTLENLRSMVSRW